MRKTWMTIAAAACIAAATVAVPTEAQARCRGCWAGAAIAAGLIGSAIVANRAYGYGSYGGYGYGGYAPTYYGGYDHAPAYSYAYPQVDYGYYRPAYYSEEPTYYAPNYYYPRRAYAPYRGYYAPRRVYGRGYYAPRRAYVRSYRHYR